MNKAGIVSTVDTTNKTVRVVIPDIGDYVTGELIVMNHAWDQLSPPVPGDKALCAFVGTGYREGFVVGFY